jgi:serine protease Do
MGMKVSKGAIVVEAMPGTPAAEAGLKAGDVVVKLNGLAVEDAGDLTRRIGSFKPSDKVELTYMRDGSEKTAQVTLADQKNETVAKADGSRKEPGALGIQIAPAKDGDKGVAIVGVDPNGTAAEQGLAAGDIILDVAGKPVSSPEDVKSGIASAKSQGKKAVMMRIQTADGARFVAVPFPQA